MWKSSAKTGAALSGLRVDGSARRSQTGLARPAMDRLQRRELQSGCRSTTRSWRRGGGSWQV